MRQWLRSHLTYANVMVTILGFLVLGGGTALASYVISSNSQVAQDTISGHKPPTGYHSNIIGGSVNGQDVADNSLTGADVNESMLSGDVRKLAFAVPFPDPLQKTKTLANVGGYTIKAECDPLLGGVVLRLYLTQNLDRPGAAEVMYDEIENGNDLGTKTDEVSINGLTTVSLASVGEATDYAGKRIGGTAMVWNFGGTGTNVMQVDFNAAVKDVPDNYPNNLGCSLYGTAVNAT